MSNERLLNMKILITGGSGFVGSTLALHLKAKYAHYDIYCLDNLKRRGSELNLPQLKENGIHFIHGDIRNPEDFYPIGKIDLLIEASAEPSVLAGIDSPPDYLIHTNFNGTINCLNFAVKNNAGFIFLSTSRIYPIQNLEAIALQNEETRFSIHSEQKLKGISEKGITEDFPLNGYRSLYGSTKLASELMIEEYAQFYNLKTIVNRCGVLTGPRQMGKLDQGVVVLWVARHFWKKSLSYIGFEGSGKQVRDMLHVDDLFDLIDIQIHDFERYKSQIFNVGGGVEISASLKEMTQICEEVVGNRINITPVNENRQADIPLYITDNTKIEKLSGWKPKKNVKTIITEVYNWIKDNEKDLKPILN